MWEAMTVVTHIYGIPFTMYCLDGDFRSFCPIVLKCFATRKCLVEKQHSVTVKFSTR